MNDILDLKKPYEELGDKPKGQADFVRQDGIIYAWSESCLWYERAWWLYGEANTPAKKRLRRERPLPLGISV